MKRLLFAGVAVLALMGADAARAADLPPGVIYPAATLPFTFTGFYVGGTVGGALGSSKYLETPGTGFGASAANVAAVGTSSAAPRGVIGGLEAGYNWQINHFVLGVEGDFSGWDLSANSGVTGAGLLPGATFSSSATVNSNWLFTLRPRLGFANGNMLTYLTGGLAVANFKFSESITGTTGPTLAGSFSNTEVGWVAGAGVEYGLSQNWFIKAEYLYTSFSNQNAVQTGPGFTGTATANLSASIVRAGVDYRF